jgi:DGQHR domain-containing protein
MTCIKQVVTSGTRRFPLFIGFSTAEELARVAEAPSFDRNTPNRGLAENVLDPPIEDWQRPLNRDRVDRIARLFGQAGTLMPNPVLLSENPYYGRHAKITPTPVSGGLKAGTFDIKVGEKNDGQLPLWILDGQHRIFGLAKSKQRTSAVPIVLLLNDGAESYNPQDFAELFAQVTTSAEKLDELHNEWLTFAFELGKYATSGSASPAEQRNAMRTVALLCANPKLSTKAPNPFLNAVRFNSFLTASPMAKQGGFGFNVIEMRDLVYSGYYSKADEPITPEDLADQIGIAYIALTKEVSPPLEETVFFGGVGDDGITYGHPYMQQAFLIGVMSYIEANGIPEDWRAVLRDLRFDETDWNFSTWVSTLSGTAGNTSKRLAARVFGDVFSAAQLPENAPNLADYLKGNAASIKVIFSKLNDKERPVKIDRDELIVGRGSTLTRALGARRHVKVSPLASTDESKNIGSLKVFDKNDFGSPRLQAMAGGSGLVVTDSMGRTVGKGRQLQVKFRMEYYGGLNSEADLTLSW